MISDLLARQPTTEDRMPALQSMDEDLINLVALLFEFVLDDHNLSPPIQVLISRLQIPILKVVVKDHSFFSKPLTPCPEAAERTGACGYWVEQPRGKEPRPAL